MTSHKTNVVRRIYRHRSWSNTEFLEEEEEEEEVEEEEEEEDPKFFSKEAVFHLRGYANS